MKDLVFRHAELTGSARARKVLVDWDYFVPRFVRVMPNDYNRVLQAQRKMRETGLSPEEAEMAAFELNVAGRGPRGRQVGAMGKPTGFIETQARAAARPQPARAHPGLGRVPRAAPGQEAPGPGRALHGLRHPLLPHRRADRRPGHRLPHPQPDPGVERPRLPRPLAGGARPPAQDEQLPRVHRPRLPGALRRLVRARHHRPAGHHQEPSRSRSSTRASTRAGSSPSRPSSAPARRSRSSAPAPPAWPPPPSSTGPATSSPSSSAPTASAAC